VPAAHVLHTAFALVFCSWYLPFKQLMHAVDKSINLFPAAQKLHDVLPVKSWYWPSEQPLQLACAF
jgi:hypothetical protein